MARISRKSREEYCSPPIPVLLYVCTCLLRCLMNLARSSRSWTALSFRAEGIRGSCLFFGLPVGVAVADLELNLEKINVENSVLVFFLFFFFLFLRSSRTWVERSRASRAWICAQAGTESDDRWDFETFRGTEGSANPWALHCATCGSSFLDEYRPGNQRYLTVTLHIPIFHRWERIDNSDRTDVG